MRQIQDFTQTHVAERTERGENWEGTVWESGLHCARRHGGGKDGVLHYRGNGEPFKAQALGRVVLQCQVLK